MSGQPQQQTPTNPYHEAAAAVADGAKAIGVVVLAGSVFMFVAWGWSWSTLLLSLALLGLVGSLWFWVRVLTRLGKDNDRMLSQARIAQLEGELGLPVVMAGECWNCHKPLAAGAKFCAYCGKTAEKPTAKVCAACQTRNPLDGMFCSECGQRLPKTV
jgi:hypothetical protein